MVGLYKDPKGENIFKKTSTAITRESESKFTECEMQGLRKRIKELEDEKDVSASAFTNTVEPPNKGHYFNHVLSSVERLSLSRRFHCSYF